MLTTAENSNGENNWQVEKLQTDKESQQREHRHCRCCALKHIRAKIMQNDMIPWQISPLDLDETSSHLSVFLARVIITYFMTPSRLVSSLLRWKASGEDPHSWRPDTRKQLRDKLFHCGINHSLGSWKLQKQEPGPYSYTLLILGDLP